MGLTRRAAGAAWYSWSRRAAGRFAAAVRDPARAQDDARDRIMSGMDLTGRGLHATLRENPISGWEQVRPLAERVADGDRTALTADPATFLEPTGGTSGSDKLVPYNGALLAEFAAATSPWVHDLMRSEPAIRRGSSYWAVSPPARAATSTAGGVQIGASHDSDYFPPVARRLIDAVLGMPRELASVIDHDAHRYVTLRALLAMDDLALISVWSPSFLTLLAGALDASWEPLLHDLERGGVASHGGIDATLCDALARSLPARPRRARRLRAALGDRAPTDLGRVWPKLALVSCWTDAQAALALDAMRERVPSVRVQGKGLLATEGVTSIPLDRYDAPVAAVGSHVLEFVPVERGGSATAMLAADPLARSDARWVHELDAGCRYEVVLTTGGGLVRYRTFDVVEVVGHADATPTPLLRFVGRADQVSDLAGEKLVPENVEQALARARDELGIAPGAWLLLLADADHDPVRYVLAFDADHVSPEHARRAASHVDAQLATAHHYGLCRSLGQLDAIGIQPIRDPVRAWTSACADLGQRTGTIKPAALDGRVALLALLRAHGGAAGRAGAEHGQR